MAQLEEPRAKKHRLHRVPWLWPLSSGLCCWSWYICWACGGLCGRWGVLAMFGIYKIIQSV